MSTILVAGGAGYIGSHTCKSLARAGFTPVAYDNLGRGHRWAVRWGPLEVGDIEDTARVSEVVSRYRPAAVMHFAGFGYVGESMAEPALYYGNNVAHTYRLLEALRQTAVRKIVFSSSCATYGGVHALPIAETSPQMPVSTYGFSKLAVERMLADYGRAYGFRSMALRYFNAAGADPEGEIGEVHEPEPHFIPTVLRVARGLEDCVRINGDDYPTADGSCVRDFIHVSDLADAHVLALKRLLAGDAPPAVNLGNGNGHSLKQIVEVSRRVTGRPIPVEIGPRREGDPPYAVGDAALARSVLGWAPRYADIAEMVESAWRWMEIYERQPTRQSPESVRTH